MAFAAGCGCATTGAATVGFGVAMICAVFWVFAALWLCALFCRLLGGSAACVCGGAATVSTGRGFTTGWVIAVTELATTELVLAAFLLAYS